MCFGGVRVRDMRLRAGPGSGHLMRNTPRRERGVGDRAGVVSPASTKKPGKCNFRARDTGLRRTARGTKSPSTYSTVCARNWCPTLLAAFGRCSVRNRDICVSVWDTGSQPLLRTRTRSPR